MHAESICRILKTQTNVTTENSSLVCGLGTGRGDGQEGRMTRGFCKTCENKIDVYYLDCGDNFTVAYIC